jgi:hypothetical protein
VILCLLILKKKCAKCENCRCKTAHKFECSFEKNAFENNTESRCKSYAAMNKADRRGKS